MLAMRQLTRLAGLNLLVNRSMVSTASFNASAAHMHHHIRLPDHQRSSLLLCFLGLHRPMSALAVQEPSYSNSGGEPRKFIRQPL